MLALKVAVDLRLEMGPWITHFKWEAYIIRKLRIERI